MADIRLRRLALRAREVSGVNRPAWRKMLFKLPISNLRITSEVGPTRREGGTFREFEVRRGRVKAKLYTRLQLSVVSSYFIPYRSMGRLGPEDMAGKLNRAAHAGEAANPGHGASLVSLSESQLFWPLTRATG